MDGWGDSFNVPDLFEQALHLARMTQGASLIMQERIRQIADEGFALEHDDQHMEGELVQAAVRYAAGHQLNVDLESVAMASWPWDESSYKPSTPIRDLIKAGALIAAEVDRLIREGVDEPSS